MGSISVNGVTYRGNSITINNDVVIIDGVVVGDENSKTINISVVGDISSINVDRCKEITVQGNVGTIVTTSGDVDVTGNVNGDIHSTSGDVECGNVKGSINTTSGDVNCEDVGGNVKTVSGDIKHRTAR